MNNQTGQPSGGSGGADAGGRKGVGAYIPGFSVNSTSAAQDPLKHYAEIIKDPNLTSQQKDFLLQIGGQRFQNRQRMAYISLGGIVATLVVILAGAVIDGLSKSTIVDSLTDAVNLLGITNGLFTAIVASYFGVTSFRPSS